MEEGIFWVASNSGGVAEGARAPSDYWEIKMPALGEGKEGKGEKGCW